MDPVAPFLVGKSDDRGFDDALAGEQHVLHFARIDVVAAGNQHVVLAVDQIEEPVLVHVADVARVQPPASKGSRGRFRIVPVIGHRLRSAADDLAALSGRERTILFVEHRGLDNGKGTSAGADPVVVLGRRQVMTIGLSAWP